MTEKRVFLPARYRIVSRKFKNAIEILTSPVPGFDINQPDDKILIYIYYSGPQILMHQKMRKVKKTSHAPGLLLPWERQQNRSQRRIEA
tara:strand:- start:644 stop:910 length:267 start_codon:yes stop_codon:yes gene_type:complete